MRQFRKFHWRIAVVLCGATVLSYLCMTSGVVYDKHSKLLYVRHRQVMVLVRIFERWCVRVLKVSSQFHNMLKMRQKLILIPCICLFLCILFIMLFLLCYTGLSYIYLYYSTVYNYFLWSTF